MEQLFQAALGIENCWIGKNALARIGALAKSAAGKALIVAGDKAWAAACRRGLQGFLEEAGVDYERYSFHGYCSEGNVTDIMARTQSASAGLLIGIGGGKCMDAVKSAADKLSLPLILAPSSCATCAAYVRLCVWYDDQGRCVPGMVANHLPLALLIDTSLIVTEGDSRLMASGMLDALAKYPEIDFSMTCTPEPERRAMLISAQALAKSNFDYVLSHGRQALTDMREGKASFAAENMVAMNIIATGLASALVSGVQQLAVAHMFHDAVASLFHEQRSRYLHGEMVAVGVLLQMHSNGYAPEEIERAKRFIRDVGGPVCLSDLEIEPTRENRERIMDYIVKHGYENEDLHSRIDAAFDAIFR